MGFTLGTTCFKCHTAISIIPFLLSVLLSSESELSLLKVTFGGFGTGISSLCGMGVNAVGKSGYFTGCLDSYMIPVMFV